MTRSLLVVTGEHSGDRHAAGLVSALRRLDPGLQIWGIGGPALRAQGVQTFHGLEGLDVVGLTDVVRHLPFFVRLFRATLREVRHRRPTCALLVDYPGFNLRLAARLHRMGVKVIYYICPQVWAWRRGRMTHMARILDRLLVIFPFEEHLFDGYGLPVHFVGHPLVPQCATARAAPEIRLPWQGACRLALLPGSRGQEVRRILPVMIASLAALSETHPGLNALIAAPDAQGAAAIRAVLKQGPPPTVPVKVLHGRTREILRQARAALVASGTATMETALMGCPMVVVYKTSALTYAVGSRLIRVPHLGMVNIVAGREICPEFLQAEATAEALAAGVAPLLSDTPRRRQMCRDLEAVAQALQGPPDHALGARLLLETLADTTTKAG